ncbi:MAG: 30S ribosomal protein S27ae [Nanoarchaeota archaeon]|nr:30S ribosomal protein S27ae [Nanoarchaeota archaeon]
MAPPEKKKAAAPAKKKGGSFQRFKLYTAAGDKATRKNKFCPKCGPESFLANHKDRLTCGKCGYVEKR